MLVIVYDSNIRPQLWVVSSKTIQKPLYADTTTGKSMPMAIYAFDVFCNVIIVTAHA